MLSGITALAATLSVGTVLAAPAMHHSTEPHLDAISCRCLTFRPNERPTPCTFLDSTGFSWRSAQTLASEYDIKIQFARSTTISRVLSIPAPLPSDILDTTSSGAAQSSHADATHNKLVCGFGQEATHLTHHRYRAEPQTHFIGQVLAWLVLFVILYAAGEFLWSKYTARRPVRLRGREKAIKALPSIKEEEDGVLDFS